MLKVREKIGQITFYIKKILCSGKTLALATAAAIIPGTIITFTASAYYADAPDTQVADGSTQCTVAIKSPIYSDKPIYLAQGWDKSNGLANGMLVRAYVDVYGDTQLVDGIQLANGKIWVDGDEFERTDPPKE